LTSDQKNRHGKFPDAWKRLMSSTITGNDELTLLQRLVSRLCVAFDGSDAHLDEVLQEVKRAMRRQNTAAELEQLLNGLTDGIRRSDDARAAAAKAKRPLDAAPAPTPTVSTAARTVPAPAAPGGTAASLPEADSAARAAAREPLLRLVDRLNLLPHLQQRLDELRFVIERCRAEAELLRVVNPLAALVNQQRADLQRERNSVAAILEQVAARLEEMTRHLGDTTALHEAAADDGSQLDAHLRHEFSALGDSARKASDLVQFQHHLSLRLEIIGAHLDKFRERELARLSDYKQRAERMSSRVSELERETHALQEQVDREQRRAYTDPLTEIPNRLAFQERITQDFAHWQRTGASLCVAFWDIDSFKSVNDTFGHPAGDKAIRIVAQHLANSLRKTDFVARYGGEEFVVILRGMSLGEAINQADRVRISLEQLGIHFEQTRIPLTASCGIAAAQPQESEENLIQRADSALYQAKKSGRNRCVAA
jgi:diguanylate cyclase